MTRSDTTIFAILIIASTSSGIAQSADPIEELKACAKMIDRDARVACLENLGERVIREESVAHEPIQEQVAQPEPEAAKTITPAAATTVAEATVAEATEATATNVQPLPENLGVTISDDEGSESVKYSGTVTSCKKGHYGDRYFIFDNGQIWREANKSRRRFKDCNFDVTITRDAFGYKMQIDALGKTVRVKRHK